MFQLFGKTGREENRLTRKWLQGNSNNEDFVFFFQWKLLRHWSGVVKFYWPRLWYEGIWNFFRLETNHGTFQPCDYGVPLELLTLSIKYTTSHSFYFNIICIQYVGYFYYKNNHVAQPANTSTNLQALHSYARLRYEGRNGSPFFPGRRLGSRLEKASSSPLRIPLPDHQQTYVGNGLMTWREQPMITP